MDKILQLANEYNLIKENGFVVDDGGWEYLEYDEEKEPILTYRNSGTYATGDDAEAILISKYYGFVKRLVENDKINLGKIKKLYRKSNEHSTATYPVMYEYSDLECLLMLLSISDTPIEDLISYLK